MAPRSKEANERIKDERRSAILLAALKIFTRKGFSAAKMSDIAEEANVSYGLVYHYFKSKEVVYLELIEHAINSLECVIEQAELDEEEPIDQIRKIILRVFDSIERNEASGYYYVLVIGAITCEAIPVSTDRIKKDALERLNKLANIIKNGQQKGQINDGNPMEIAITCFSVAIGLASLKISGTIVKLPDSQILMKLLSKSL